jgi:HEPN domain
MRDRSPLWGNFIHHADRDLLAFGLLAYAQMYPEAFYHGTQAIEKYLKALYLSIKDPDGHTATPETEKWIKGKDGHNLEKLAQKCGVKYSYYIQKDVLNHLRRFTEFDQLARYPWVDQKYGNGFTSADVSHFGEIACRLRNDIPIQIDNYMLGMEVREHFHNTEKSPHQAWPYYSHQAVTALSCVMPDIKSFVRW